MKADIRGTQIYFDVAGMQLAPKGKEFVERPVLFMLHGGPGGDHLRFKQHSLELEKSAQLIFIDHRGCGRSKKTHRSEYTLENNIEDIEALRIYLGLDKISILGTSYGGVVAQGYAIRYPKQVDKLILVVTSPSYRFIEKAKEIVRERGTKAQVTACEPLWDGSFKSTKQVSNFWNVMESMYSMKAKKSTKKSPSSTTWSHEALNNGFSDSLRHYDYVPQLKKIKAKTLILAGDKDWICHPMFSRELAKHIPNSTLKIFKNCGHSLAIDAHDAYIKTIQRFLK